jgi:cytochrome c-type biogenesis protein CcmF
VLLAIFAFSLSLLGTFLVRSGVLTSVHAFASDPARGVFILVFLCVVVGGSLALYAARAAQIRSLVSFNLISRETALLLNNVVLVVATASVLLGTLYPLALDALNLGKISVGPPYFNAVFVPLMLLLLATVGVGAYTRWKEDRIARLRQALSLPLAAAIVLGAAFPFLMGEWKPGAALGMALAFWVVLATAQTVRERLAGGRAIASVPAGFWGMVLGHLGLAAMAVGITLTSLYSHEKDVRMAPGDTYELGGHAFTFQGVVDYRGPNYVANQGTVLVERNGQPVATLKPSKRVYNVQRMPMTEAGIDAGLFRDLFVALGDPLDGGAWAVRLYHKPFVRWIWLGALIMGIGGIVAAGDRRYRALARRATAPAGAAAEAAR